MGPLFSVIAGDWALHLEDSHEDIKGLACGCLCLRHCPGRDVGWGNQFSCRRVNLAHVRAYWPFRGSFGQMAYVSSRPPSSLMI